MTLAALGVAIGLSLTAAPPAHAESKALAGTFGLTAGACPSGKGTGTYFRMVQPSGTVANGPFVSNGDSTCSDKTFTLLNPGTDGGLTTGTYQSAPNPVFDSAGNSLATRLTQPATFFGVKFGLSTDATELQTKKSVPAVSVTDDNGSLSADLRAFTASWNNQYFQQGSPKADGSTPGLTTKAKGTLNPSTNAFVLEWTSTIVGGPFNDFTGSWHLEGTFYPAGTTPVASGTKTTTVSGAKPSNNATAATVAGSNTEQVAAGTTDTTAVDDTKDTSVAIAAKPSKGWRPPAWLIVVTALVGIGAAVGFVATPRPAAEEDPS